MSKRLLTIFGSTGQQGGSVVDAFLAHPELAQKYKLRGITRNVDSDSATKLKQQGVEMVAANFNEPESLRKAVSGSYGVFGVTNFWDRDVMDKKIEIQQGKNLFDAVKAEGVKHYVYSSLPWAEKLTKGVLKNVDHFDGKAEVEEYIEAQKGDMIASFYLPAIYMDSYNGRIKTEDDKTTLTMPYQLRSEDADRKVWPVVHPRADSGKYVLGLFEGEQAANGVKVNGVSAWISPNELLAHFSKKTGSTVTFKGISLEEHDASMSFLPQHIARELTETMVLVGEYYYYGEGAWDKQAESDKWLLKGSKPVGL